MDKFILEANRSALDYVQAMDFPKAWASLRAAEVCLSSKEAEVLPNRLKLLALTYNNFSCYFKRKMRLDEALQCLSQALILETQNADEPTAIAATHLNICAVYSDKRDHKSALSHAQFALDLLSRFALTVNDFPNLVIAYYNVAAEMEHLNMKKDSAEIYRQGLTVSEQKLGPDHPLTLRIAEAFRNAVNRLRPPRLRHDQCASEKLSQRPKSAVPSSSKGLKSSFFSPQPGFPSTEKRNLRLIQPIESIRRLNSREKNGNLGRPATPSIFATVDNCLSTVKKIQAILDIRRTRETCDKLNL